MTPIDFDSLERILLVRLDNIGDVVMLSPSINALRERCPQATITLLCSKAGAQVAPLIPDIDELMVEQVVWQDAFGDMPQDPHRELELVGRLREKSFDASFIFTSFSQSPYPPAYACYLAGIPIRVAQTEHFGGSLLSHWVTPPPPSTHQALRNCHLMRSVGIDIEDTSLMLSVPEEVESSVTELLAACSITEPFISIAPGASCSARRYGQEDFLEVAARLSQATQQKVLILGSDREHELVDALSRATLPSGVVSLVGRTSVVEFAEVLRRSSVIIGNDSSAMHFADAFQRPMVILFSGTDLEEQWRPRRSLATLLRRPTPCAPCYGFKCRYNMECLDFSPQEVVSHVLDLVMQQRELPSLSV